MPFFPVKCADCWITLSDGKKLNLGGCILTWEPDARDVEKARPERSSLKQKVSPRQPIDAVLEELLS